MNRKRNVMGAFEAKTHLSSLLERVAAGEQIIITRHGKEIAHLIPPPGKPVAADVLETIRKWREVRRGITLGNLKVRDLIDEGRR